VSSSNTLTNTSDIGTPGGVTSRDFTPDSKGSPLPPSRKKRLQRQTTLLEKEQPTPKLGQDDNDARDNEARDNEARDKSHSGTDTRDKSEDSDHTTASDSLLEQFNSNTMDNIATLPTVTECRVVEELAPSIQFRRSSFDLSKPTICEETKMRYQRLCASESEILELLTPTAPSDQGIALTNESTEQIYFTTFPGLLSLSTS